jgi:hypothetical protein
MAESLPVAVVLAWHDALNAADHERVLELSDPDVEIVGPRGSGFGHALLRQWLDHTRVSLMPKRVFARGGSVVVGQRARWASPETGETIGEADVASHFRVKQGRISYYARFDETSAALEQAGLAEQDVCITPLRDHA